MDVSMADIMGITLYSLGLVTCYGYVAVRAWQLLWLPMGTAGWKRAWAGVLLMAVLILARRALIAVDLFIPGYGLRPLFMHPVFTFGVPALAALTFVGIAREISVLFLSRHRHTRNAL
jgi:hypothetical protein